MIILGWKSLSTLVIQASDREWVQELKDRALEIYTLELRLFARKSRRVRLMAKSGVTQHMLSTISDEYALMSRILDCWRSLTFRDREDDREENARSKRGARSAARSDARDRHAQTEKTSLVDASLSLRIETPPGRPTRPVRFSRALQRVELACDAADTSSELWKTQSQPSRLDSWNGMVPAPWLQAVRQEIPRQYTQRQVGARGTRIPPLWRDLH